MTRIAGTDILEAARVSHGWLNETELLALRMVEDDEIGWSQKSPDKAWFGAEMSTRRYHLINRFFKVDELVTLSSALDLLYNGRYIYRELTTQCMRITSQGLEFLEEKMLPLEG